MSKSLKVNDNRVEIRYLCAWYKAIEVNLLGYFLNLMAIKELPISQIKFRHKLGAITSGYYCE